MTHLPWSPPPRTTRYLDYDLFGRARRIRPPDGQAHEIRHGYSGIRQVSRTVKIATSASGETSFTTSEVCSRCFLRRAFESR